jgi:hypothetical protein
LSPFQAAVEKLTAAWNNMLNAFANTSAIQGAMNAITGLFSGLAGIVNGVSSSAGANAASSWNAMGAGLTGLPTGNSAVVNGMGVGGALNLIQQYENASGQNVPNYRYDRTHTAQGYFQITNSTWRDIAGSAGVDLGQYPNAMSAPYDVQRQAAAALYQQRGFAPWANYNPRLAQAIAGSGYGSGLVGSAGGSAPATNGSGLRAEDATTLGKINDDLQRQKDELAALTPEWQKFGSAQQAGVAAEQARIKVLEEGGTQEQANAAAAEARNRVIAETTAQLSKEQQVQKATTEGALAEAKAYGIDAVAGYKAAADAQARLLVMQEPLKNFEVERQRLLEAGAAEAINASAKALPALQQQIEANQRLADAAKLGSAAEHEAGLQNQIAAATHDAVAKAAASENDALKAQAQALTDQTAARIKANEQAKVAAELAHQTNVDRNDIQIMQLEVSLQGQTTEEISRQVALLREKQRLDALGSSVTQQERDDRLAVVDALGRENSALVEAQRNQQRLDEGVRQIADTVDNTLVKAMQDAFDGKKVTDWGATLKSVVSQILSGILNFALIRPVIGSVVGALGFNSVASQFGSFGGIGGASSTGGGLNTGSLLQGGGLLKDLFGGSSSTEGGLFGGVNNFLNNTIGTNLGFAGSGIVNGTGAGSGIFTNLATGATSDVAGSGVASGLFGGTTFSGFLGGAGLGFGAGSLLNSLIGGNRLGGTVGSGLGSLAGAAIGSIIPGIGTLIGGLLGGAGGGLLGGLFGNNRPANNESAAGIDLATGRITSSASHGVAANDQMVQQIIQPLSQFVQSLLSLTGGALNGQLGIQAGSRDGVKLMFGGTTTALTDPAQLQQAELTIARTLTGLSDTMKTVIDHVTDPSQIQAAVQFAAVYDKLKEAAQDDFKAIDAAIGQADKATGPFATAMQQLTATFGTLHDQAVQFGLSVDVVDRSLARATQHLQQDFRTALDQAFNQASGQGFLNDLQTAVTTYQQNINEAIALGLSNSPTTDRIVSLFYRQINSVLSQLTPQQLDTVIANFTDLESTMQDLSFSSRQAMDGIIALSEAQRDASAAAQAAAQSQLQFGLTMDQLLQGVDQQVQQYQSTFGAAFRQIHDFVLSLQTAVSPFTSPESRLHAAQTQYQGLLTGAQGGDLASLQQISGSAQTYLQTIGQYYASSAAGQDLFAQVNAQLSALGGGGPSGPGKPPTIVNDPNIPVIDTSLKTLTAVAVAAGDTAASQGEQTIALLTQVVAAVAANNQTSGFTSGQKF